MPVDPTVPTPRTPAQKAAARAARQAARPLRDHPNKGQPKPKANIGGTRDPKAVRPAPGEHRQARKDVDGYWRLSMLDPTSTVSEFILLTPATPAL